MNLSDQGQYDYTIVQASFFISIGSDIQNG